LDALHERGCVMNDEGRLGLLSPRLPTLPRKNHAETELRRLLHAAEAEKDRLSLVLRGIDDEDYLCKYCLGVRSSRSLLHPL
jgi:hypothetical protein